MQYALNEKKSSRRENEENLRSILGEAMNQSHTEQDLFQTGLGCTLGSPFADMKAVKAQWHKLGGVEGYHLVQSFAPGEVTPELAHQIGLELAERLLDGQFQAVVSTHLNTRCIHNHIVWNSVSLVDGRKYRSTERSYYTQVRRISDELCWKYGLSLIQPGRTGQPGRSYAQWQAEQEGKPTWKTPIQRDVDEAIARALTWRQFVREMEGRGDDHQARRGAAMTQDNKTCGRRFGPVTDRDLLAAIQVRLEALCQNPSLAEVPLLPQPTLSMEAVRLTHEIQRAFMERGVDTTQVLGLIHQCAAEKYKTCAPGGSDHITIHLKRLLEQHPAREDLLERALRKIILQPECDVRLHLVNGKIF